MPSMLDQESGIGRAAQVEQWDDSEVIQTDFIVEYTGLGSNLPEIDALNSVNDKTGGLSYIVNPNPDSIKRVVQRLDELGRGIIAASFNPGAYRDNPGQTSQDKI